MFAPARLRLADVVRLGEAGVRARPTRVVLSALGIAIGIGAMVSVVGISTTSWAELDRQLAALGTNLLTVAPGQRFSGEASHLPAEAVGMIGRIGPATSVSSTGQLIEVQVYWNDHIPSGQRSGIAVMAARTDLLETVGGGVASGAFLNRPRSAIPPSSWARPRPGRLGVPRAEPEQQVWLGGEWFTVVGILRPTPLAPELDNAALIGLPVAEDRLGFDEFATTVYARSREDAVEAVGAVLAATANPEHPNEVAVSRPSDALAAKRVADRTLNALLLGLGGVALLVDGVGVAKTPW